MRRSRAKISGLVGITILATGLVIPQHFRVPVEGANHGSYHPKSFWYYPWGKSGTHKGVDIFSREGTTVVSATGGFVLFTGQIERGGNVILILGPKWRLHYYGHLMEIDTHSFALVTGGEKIGTVGTSGNAVGKAPHLHYSIATIVPYVWRIDRDHQGWKKMFYLNPIDFLRKAE